MRSVRWEDSVLRFSRTEWSGLDPVRSWIGLQRRAHLFRIRTWRFQAGLWTIWSGATAYRSAARKLMQVGIETKDKIRRQFTAEETKAFEASSLDSAFFSPELLGIVVDCNIMCAELLDLYGSVTVGKSQFMYPWVNGLRCQLASTGCGAKCDLLDTDPGLTSSSSRVRYRTSVACSASSARFFRKPIIRFWTSCSVQRLALTASTATAR